MLLPFYPIISTAPRWSTCGNRPPKQLVVHQESTRRQYQLAERAATLGWPQPRIVVVDEDLLLQLELGRRNSSSPFVMTRFRHSLMVTPKEGPGYDMSVGDHLAPDQGPD